MPLTVSGLVVLRSGRPVISGLDLEVPDGSITGLLGPNGAGKSTLLQAIAGLIPSRGSVRIEGREVSKLSAHARARLGVRFLGGRWVVPGLSVREHLALVRISGAAPDLDWIFELFPRLRERLDTAVGDLSGGEQQMVALAAAIGSQPRVLLLDEPSFGLAPQVVGEVFHVLAELRRRSFTILVAEQQSTRLLDLADNVWILRGGRIETEQRVDAGRAEALKRTVLEAYFGREEARGVPASAVVEELVSLRLPVGLKRRLQIAAREKNTEPAVLASETLAAWLQRRSG